MVLGICAALFCVTSCDFIRTVAGRPTSDELAALKAEELINMVEDFVASMDTVSLEDTLACEDTLEAAPQVTLDIPVMDWSDQVSAPQSARYYLMVGIFSNAENASAQARWARNSGYPVTMIKFSNGRTGVGVLPSDSLEIYPDALSQIRSKAFCPKDIFILDTRG